MKRFGSGAIAESFRYSVRGQFAVIRSSVAKKYYSASSVRPTRRYTGLDWRT